MNKMTEKEFKELIQVMRIRYPFWDTYTQEQKKYYASRAGYKYPDFVTRAPHVDVKHFRGSAKQVEKAMLNWENYMYEHYENFRVLDTVENMEFPTFLTMEWDVAVTYSI